MDVDARFKAAEEKIKQATSLGQAFGVIAQALLDLNDSHTYFRPPALGVRAEYGWEMQMIGDRPYVVAVEPGSDAAAKGLKPGDLIVSIDNFRPSRKELWKMEYYYNVLSPRKGLHLVVQSPGAGPRELDVAARMVTSKRSYNLTGGGSSDIDINEILRDAEDSSKALYHRYRRAGGVFIWKMPLFGDPENVEKMMNDEVKGASALILDLRGNPGGAIETLEILSGYFLDDKTKIADRKSRKDQKPMVARRRGAPFDGKLVVLVDSESASCSEIFARLVQLNKRGVVIGDQSMGAVMQSLYHPLQVGQETIVFYGASITDADVIMPDGKSLEHVGVTPDELLLPTAEDLAAQRDPVLARAAAVLGFQLDPAKAGAMFPVEWKK
jgi:C-terminal processing protease CtpA/Prc